MSARVVLVHGAWHGAWCWDAVVEGLRAEGVTADAVDLPGHGDDTRPLTDLYGDAARVTAALDALATVEDDPVVLVGHSYGGAIITEAGNDPKVAGLVYICAFQPDANETLLSLLQAGPPAPNSGILPPDQNGYVWYDMAKYHSGFCADLPREQAAFLADSQIPVNASVFGASIAQPAWKTKPSWYVIGTEDQTIPPDGQRFMAKRAGSKVTEIKGSHLVFMSRPKEVADVIETAAKAAVK